MQPWKEIVSTFPLKREKPKVTKAGINKDLLEINEFVF